MQINGRSPGEMLRNMKRALAMYGHVVTTDRWQGKENPLAFLELIMMSGECNMLPDEQSLIDDLKPWLPWAQEHFKERVQGFPTNPDPSHKRWLKGNEEYKVGEIFSHTYSERLWPKSLYQGIRFNIGDLYTAVELLKKDNHTRQLVVPMYMHEDLTAAKDGHRVPCSLVWSFIYRGGQLHCSYIMRSTDAVRHAHNDLYFANMLTLWLIKESGIDALPGRMTFNSTSFHCFENDRPFLEKI